MNAKIVVILMVIGVGSCKELAHCSSWNDMKKHLEKRGKTKCNLLPTCTEINCSGVYLNYTYDMKLSVLGCDDPLTLSLFADIPKMNVDDWKENFTSSPQFVPLQGAKITGQSVSLEAWVYLVYKTVDKTEVRIEELEIQGCATQPTLKSREKDCPKNAPVIKNVTVKVPKCEDKKITKKEDQILKEVQKYNQGCNASIPEECPQDRACTQNNDGSSTCECRTGTRDEDGLCVPDDVPVPTPAAHSSSGLSRSNTAVAVVVPLIVVAGLIILVWLKRRGAFRRFRAPRVRRYEELMIGDTDLNGDDDDDPPLA